MTREEAIRCLSVHSSTNGSGLCTDEQHFQAKQMAIQALEQNESAEEWYKLFVEKLDEQQPCDDAVSRILERMWNCRGKHTTSIDKVRMEQIIRDELPSVTQKSEKWIDDEFGSKCSCCGIHTQCGAKMESEDKNEL